MDVLEGRAPHVAFASPEGTGTDSSPVAGVCLGANLSIPEGCDHVRVELSVTRFVSITQLVALTQYLSLARSLGVPVSVGSGEVGRYAARMNMYSLVGIEMGEGFTRHPPGNDFIPMERVCEVGSPNVIASRMRNVVMEHVRGIDDSVVGYVDNSFGEIMDNVMQHAESAALGIAAAQYYPRKGYVELCVADSGRGIAASMAANPDYAHMDRFSLVANAFEEGFGEYVGHTDFARDKASGGRGLTIAARVAKALHGHIWAVSRDEAVHVSDAGTEAVGGLFYPGTVVSMRLPVGPASRILESDVMTGGRDVPVYWSPFDGSYTDADELLW